MEISLRGLDALREVPSCTEANTSESPSESSQARDEAKCDVGVGVRSRKICSSLVKPVVDVAKSGLLASVEAAVAAGMISKGRLSDVCSLSDRVAFSIGLICVLASDEKIGEEG